MFTTMLFYVATVAGLLVVRKKRPDAHRHYRVPLYPFLPVVYMVATAVIMIGMVTLHPAYAGAGLAIVVSGLPAYFLWQRKHAA
jgi:APA family basic amino acid/polyamine antiporter